MLKIIKKKQKYRKTQQTALLITSAAINYR